MKVNIEGNISEEMEVTNLSEYIEKCGLDTEDESLYERADMQVISQIIAIEVAYFLMRRTAYLCGSNGDIIWALRRELITRYKNITGQDFNNLNEDVDF